MTSLLPRLQEWALNVLEGKTYSPPVYGDEHLAILPDGGLYSFEDATRPVPPRRTRAAMVRYVECKNRARWRQLQRDYKWLQQCMIEMERNPEDAKFLL